MISKRYHYGINFVFLAIFIFLYTLYILGLWKDIHNFFCFISTIPGHCIHSNIKISKYNFIFNSLTFIFQAILQSFKETSFNQLLSGAMSYRGTNTENSLIRESNLEGHKSPFWISVNLSDTFKTWASNPFVWIFLWVRKIGPNTFVLIWCIWWWLIRGFS